MSQGSKFERIPTHKECKCREYSSQTRLGGEICSSDVIMHKGHSFSKKAIIWIITYNFDIFVNSIKTLNFSAAEFKTVLAQVIYPQGQSVLRSFKNLVTNSDEDIWKSLETLKEEKYEQKILSIKYFQGTKMTKKRNCKFYHGRQHCCWSRAGKVEC